MPHRLLRIVHPREYLWLAPFVCVAVIVLGLLCPPPHLPDQNPAHSRTMVDAEGRRIQIALPFRGTARLALTPADYLEDTHAPETIVYAGGSQERSTFARDVASWVYPEILKNNSLWDDKVFRNIHGPYMEVEAALAYDPGVYLVFASQYSSGPLLRHIGLTTAAVTGNLAKNIDEVFINMARTASAPSGNLERAEALIVRNQKAFAELERDLQPATLVNQPRVLCFYSKASDWTTLSLTDSFVPMYLSRAGVMNAATGHTGRRLIDAERVLIMDPDIIFLAGSHDGPRGNDSPEEFMRDPRWRGLKAVQEKRVYKMYGEGRWGGLIYEPLYMRFVAELAHSDRMQPLLREKLRERVMTELGYHLSDDQIDKMLHIDENKDSAGTERFERNYQANNGREPIK